jgi:hypothetical protein
VAPEPIAPLISSRCRSAAFTFIQVSIFWSKNNIYSPPPFSKNYIFPPSHDTSSFNSCCAPCALILPYFAFILPFNFTFFPFSFLFLPFFTLSSFFFDICHLFFLLFILFLQMTLADIPRGIFQNIEPCVYLVAIVLNKCFALLISVFPAFYRLHRLSSFLSSYFSRPLLLTRNYILGKTRSVTHQHIVFLFPRSGR